MTTPNSARIRAVLFDAFGTLFRPRQPIHVQYAQVAQSYGLVVTPEEVKVGFKQAFSEVNAEHALYGKYSTPPLHYNEWWSQVIERTFRYANVAESDLQVTLPTLLPALLHRFWSDEGYILHNDTMDCLREIKAQGLSMGVVTNSDPRIVDVLKSLGITPEFVSEKRVTVSWDVGVAKPSGRIFMAGCDKLSSRAQETLMVGDDLEEDVNGAASIDMPSVLLKRVPHEASYVRKEVNDTDLAHVNVLNSLNDLPDWISHFNRRHE